MTRKGDGSWFFTFFINAKLADKLTDWVPGLEGDFKETTNATTMIGFKLRGKCDDVYDMCLRRIASQHLAPLGKDPLIWK